jgi:FHA domain-containing protein
MDAEPVAVALKFGFIAVLYLFLLWVARSARKDLSRTAGPVDATGLHAVPGEPAAAGEAWLVVEQGGGFEPGQRFDLFGGATIGRSQEADVQIEDRYSSQVHARVYARRGSFFLEDMNSTNGTFLNSVQLDGEAELGPHDQIRIGDTIFRFET